MYRLISPAYQTIVGCWYCCMARADLCKIVIYLHCWLFFGGGYVYLIEIFVLSVVVLVLVGGVRVCVVLCYVFFWVFLEL